MTTKLATLLTTLLLLLVGATVDGRPGTAFHPCNTLIISTYSFSLHHPSSSSSSDLFIIDLRPPLHHLPFPRRPDLLPSFPSSSHLSDASHDLPLFGFSSLKERTRDILSVVASLLFGAFCGALTASTMYVVWSLLNCRRSVDEFGSDSEDDIDDVFNPKKGHYYVAIPSTSPVKEEEKKDVVAAKEAV